MRHASVALIILLTITGLAGFSHIGIALVSGAGLRQHSPIFISGNADFTAANGVVSGIGTVTDPYLISGWNISSPTGNGIEILNTTAYFVVSNLTIQGSVTGIYINNSANFKILDDNIYKGVESPFGFSTGLDIAHSFDLTVANSTISPGDVVAIGVQVSDSSRVTVLTNTIFGGGEGGDAFALLNSSTVTVDGNQMTGSTPSPTHGVSPGLDVVGSTGVRITANTETGVQVSQSSNVGIWGDTTSDIQTSHSFNMTISQNAVKQGDPLHANAIFLDSSSNIVVTANNVTAIYGTGITLAGSDGVQVFHNNLIDSHVQASDDSPYGNSWDNGYPSGGNFWSDYTGVDHCSGPGQNVCPSPDGIGDTPYVFSSNIDRYPLVKPFALPIVGSVTYAPSTLQPKSGGKYLAATVTLSGGLNASNIVLSSIRLHLQVPLAPETVSISTANGLLMLLARFNRVDVKAMFGLPGSRSVLIDGNILTQSSFRPFVASATIRLVGVGPETLTSPNPQIGGVFGLSAAISGSTMVIGAPGDIVAGFFVAGDAYVLSTSGSLLATLATPNPVSYGEFGFSVAVNGSIVVVGAPFETAAGLSMAGHAYIFSTTGSIIAQLTSPNAQTNGYFGASVAVNGNMVIVGAFGETAGLSMAGHAYIFSTTGSLITTLASPNPQDSGLFGSVAVSGNSVVVGAPGEKAAGSGYAGHVYIFSTAGSLIATLTSPNPQSYGYFGNSVAANGNTVVVSAPDEAPAGRVYLFSTSGSLIAALTSPSPNTDGFGGSVAVSADRVVVGAHLATADGVYQAGGAYVFSTSGSLIATLTSPNPESDGDFGFSVAVSGHTVLVGADEETAAGLLGAGHAYLMTVP